MNLLKRILWGLLIGLVSLTACKTAKKVSDDTAVAPTEDAMSADSENSLIWEISGKDLSEPSYLYGTIHIIGDQDFFWPKGTEESFAKTKHLMLELDFDDKGLMMQIGMAAIMKDQTMKDLLTEEQYARFKSFLLDSAGVSKMELMAAERMKPVLGMGLLYPQMINGKLMSYEEELTKMAKRQKIEVSGLETVDDQIAALDEIPLNDQVDMFMEMIDSFDEQKAMFRKMLDLYKQQNLKDLVGMMSEYEEISNVQEDLLDDRNTRWIPKIKEQTAKEATFIAVGAAHLYGEKGVIQLLRNEGYQVKALPQ